MKVAQRFSNQANRIDNGVKTGQLTKNEASKLEKKENKIMREFAKDKFDGGKLTKHEQSKFDRKMDKLSGKIENQKHDGQRANAPLVEKSISNLEKRLEAGTKDGSLTAAEQTKMQGQIDQLKADLQAAGDGGKLTRHERRELRADAAVDSIKMFVNRHDSQE